MAPNIILPPERSASPPPTSAPETEAIGNARSKTRGSRHRVIAVAILAQTLVLAGGWFLAYHSFKNHVAKSIEHLVFSKNVDTADMLADVIAELGPQEIRYGTPAWERLQTLVEQTRLSSGGFACILDAQDKILCHPDIRKNPQLLGKPMADKVLEQPDGQNVELSKTDPSRTITGRVVISEGNTHYVATRVVPNINGRLNVHQPEQGLVSAGELATQGFILPGAIAGATVLIMTTVIVSYLMRRHDRVLETVNEDLEDEVRSRVSQATQTRNALIAGLAKLADYRDTDTGSHLDRIAEYSVLLAEALGQQFPEIDEIWIDTLRIASSMHDIGKVGIPDAILLKPGAFTPEERQRIEQHPIFGADTLIAVRETMGRDDLVEMSIRITLYHHERWDGTGYPTGLAGEDIPLEARIVAVADVYDALTSKRVYKDAVPHDKVVQIIQNGAGAQFDPALIEAFLKVAQAFNQVRSRLQPPTPVIPDVIPA